MPASAPTMSPSKPAARLAPDPAWSWRAAACCVAAALFASNAWHILAQSGTPAWDDAWYLEESFRVFHALKRGLGAFLGEYSSAFKIKAPLIALVPLPLYAVFGTGEKVALWANQAILAVTLWLVYRIGRELHGERAGCAAAIAAALTPLLYGLSRVFLVECLLTAVVAWAQWLILRAGPGRRRAARLGAVLGLGLLAKVFFPVYAAGALWLKRHELKPTLRVAGLAALAVASTWYAFNAVYVLGFAVKAGFGSVVRETGAAAGVLGAPNYLRDIAANGLSWAGLACALSLILTAGKPRWRRQEAAPFLLCWLVLPFAVFLFGMNKDIRYLAPALPALAVLVGAAAATLAERGRLTLPVGSAAVMLAVLGIQTFGWGPALSFNGAPRRQARWDRAGLVDAARRADGSGVFAVALEHPELNANNLSSIAASTGDAPTFVNLGYAQRTVEAALIRLKDKGAGHVIVFDGVPTAELPDYLNRVNDGVRAALGTRSLPARPESTVSLAPGVTATIWRLAR